MAADSGGSRSPRPDADCDASPLSLLTKAHLLLQAFAAGPTTIGLTDLSRRSGVAKGSVHRVATELVELGYLARTEQGYQLGWRIFELGRLVPGPAALREVARPAMQDLRSATGGVVHLSMPQDGDVVYLERFAGRREKAITLAVGDRVPLYRTPSGWILLAHADERVVSALQAESMKWVGTTDPRRFHQMLDDIRRRRYAEDRKILPGFKSISVPVFFPGSDHVVAAVSVTVGADRKDEMQLRHALWVTAVEISKGLSGRSADAKPAGSVPRAV